jgi:hypothetical protein
MCQLTVDALAGRGQVLVKGEPNISYICSRYYRAPELIFGASDYTTAIDLWSVGCVMAELMLGQPLFPGESGVDQLVEIIKVCAPCSYGYGHGRAMQGSGQNSGFCRAALSWPGSCWGGRSSRGSPRWASRLEIILMRVLGIKPLEICWSGGYRPNVTWARVGLIPGHLLFLSRSGWTI